MLVCVSEQCVLSHVDMNSKCVQIALTNQQAGSSHLQCCSVIAAIWGGGGGGGGGVTHSLPPGDTVHVAPPGHYSTMSKLVHF